VEWGLKVTTEIISHENVIIFLQEKLSFMITSINKKYNHIKIET
jgi:hypothetical protein